VALASAAQTGKESLMLSQPTPEQARWLLLASRWTESPVNVFIEARTGGWRSVGLLTRTAFFFLGVVAAAMTFGIVEIMRMPASAVVAGLLLIVVAEWLIATRRLSNVGIEAALELSGLLLVMLWMFDIFHSGNDTSAALAVTIAFAIAGWRLRNPLFTLLAAIAASITVAIAIDKNSFLFTTSNGYWASLYCYAVALVALILGARQLRRPAHDHMLDWLVVVMPLAGYLWSAYSGLFSAGINYLYQPSIAELFVVLTPLLFAALSLTLGLRRRTHAPLLACMVCIACVAYELRGISGLSLEQRLILWGCVTLIGAVILDRYLRTPRRGITSQPLSAEASAWELLQLAGAAVTTPAQPSPQQPGYEGGGGKFGGGGAGGHY
jgi:hypothetical protein